MPTNTEDRKMIAARGYASFQVDDVVRVYAYGNFRLADVTAVRDDGRSLTVSVRTYDGARQVVVMARDVERA